MKRFILITLILSFILGCVDKTDSASNEKKAEYNPKIQIANFQMKVPSEWLEKATQYMIEFAIRDNSHYRIIGYHSHDKKDFETVIADWQGLFDEFTLKKEIELLSPDTKMFHMTGTFQRQVYPRSQKRFPIRKYGVLLGLIPSSHGPYWMVLEGPEDILRGQLQVFTKFMNSYQKTEQEVPSLHEIVSSTEESSGDTGHTGQTGHTGHGGHDGHTHASVGDSTSVAYADFVLKIPSAWRKKPPTSKMRLVEIEVDKDPAHRVVGFYFGEVDLSKKDTVKQNFDRWVGQFVELKSRDDIIENDNFALVKLIGKFQNTMNPNAKQQDDFGMLGAVVHSNEGPYYFKLVAPQPVVDRAQQNFVEFLSSYAKREASVNVPVTDSKLVSYANFEMHLPQDWTQQKSASSMRLVEFVLNKHQGYKVVGYYFGNQGMNHEQAVQSNLQRWRGQFQKLEKETTIPLKHKNLFLVQLTGVFVKKARPMDPQGVPTPGFSFLAAVISSSQGPYYFRLEAPLEVVEAEKQNFINFLNSCVMK